MTKATIELLDITPNAEQKIASYAAICYDSDTSEEANNRRIKHLMKVKHLATLRFAHATFKVSGISRACSHQFVRSKHLVFLQRSQRYCSEGGFEYVEPVFNNVDEMITFRTAMEDASIAYNRLIELGMKKEDSRAVLPNATTTELIVTGNLQAWKDFIKLRSTKAAQQEIREVALDIQEKLMVECPNVFKKEIDNG